MKKLLELELFLFDLDGSLYYGTKALDGAAELVNYLRSSGKKVLFLTNNSLDRCSKIAERLIQMGIESSSNEVISPLKSAGKYLLDNYGKCRVYLIGSGALRDNLLQSKHDIVNENGLEENCDIVFVGKDLNFNYNKLEKASFLLQRGAKLVVTNLDSSHTVENGLEVPETGSIVAAIREVYKSSLSVIGKPNNYLFEEALIQTEVSKKMTAIIGDNLQTDIAGGKALGLFTIWFNKNQEINPMNIKADMICYGPRDLYERFKNFI